MRQKTEEVADENQNSKGTCKRLHLEPFKSWPPAYHLSFVQIGCPSYRSTNSVGAVTGYHPASTHR